MRTGRSLLCVGVSLTETPLGQRPPMTETPHGQKPPWTETPWTETPNRDPLDRDPLDRDISLDRDPQPLDRDPHPLDRDPLDRAPLPQTQTLPLTETPGQKSPLDRDPPGQRPPWTCDLWYMLGQRAPPSPWTESQTFVKTLLCRNFVAGSNCTGGSLYGEVNTSWVMVTFSQLHKQKHSFQKYLSRLHAIWKLVSIHFRLRIGWSMHICAHSKKRDYQYFSLWPLS